MHDVPEACLWLVTTAAFWLWEGARIMFLPFLILTVVSFLVEVRKDTPAMTLLLVVSVFVSPLFLATSLGGKLGFTLNFFLCLVGIVGCVLGFGFGIFLAKRWKAGKSLLPFLKWPIRS